MLTCSCIIPRTTMTYRDDRQRPGQPDLLDRDPARQAQGLDARDPGRPRRQRIARIEIGREPEIRTVGPLHHVHHDRPGAGRDPAAERAQMPRPARGRGVRELRAQRALEMYVLDLDKAIRPPAAGQQEIDPTPPIVSHLPPDFLVPRKLRHEPGPERLLDQPVGMHGIDPDQPARDLDQLQRQRQLPRDAGRARQPDRRPRRVQPQHPPGIRAMHRDQAAVLRARRRPETACSAAPDGRGSKARASASFPGFPERGRTGRFSRPSRPIVNRLPGLHRLHRRLNRINPGPSREQSPPLWRLGRSLSQQMVSSI